jgi:hypothetical protein
MRIPSEESPAGIPGLSVVVVPLSGGASLLRCLEALQAQLPSGQLEIIVSHDDALDEVSTFRRRFPGVRFLQVANKSSYARFRTAGVRSARGRIVAITEDQCIPPPPWGANILKAHETPHAAIGGPIGKLTPDTSLGWAIYLREFTGYIPPVTEGPSASLTDCNVSYKRVALDAIGDVWAEAFHESEVHDALLKRGETLWLSPQLVTLQQRSMSLGTALRERRDFGRLYGSLRAKDLSAWKRVALVIASPLLPLLLTGRVVLAVLRKGHYLGACLRAFPYIALFATVWSWGEMLGYLTGTPSESS